MREDLSGRKFGLLTVIGPFDDEITKSGVHIPRWECRCECGAIVVTRGSSLKSGHTKGCGQKHRAVKDMTGQRFNKLTVIERADDYVNKNGTKDVQWLCRCECGVERDIRAGTLVSGNSLSCGCYKHEKLSELSKLGFGISRAERCVNDFLSHYAEYYESQVIYSDLRGNSGYPLSYDFAVYKDSKVALLIECQGRQHYEPVEYFGGQERFVVQQANDNKKRVYAAKHNIALLEIPYTCVTDESIIQLLMTYNNGLFSYECP